MLVSQGPLNSSVLHFAEFANSTPIEAITGSMNNNDSMVVNDGNDEINLYQVPTFVVVILSLFYGIISLTAFVGKSMVKN